MWSRWAGLSSVLVAVRPIAASYVPKGPNDIEPTYAAVASNHLLGVSPRVTDSPIPDPRGLVGRADALDRSPNTCGFYSDGYPLLCYTSTATCVYGSRFAACCSQGTTCSSMFTGCYPYSDYIKGSCSSDNRKTEPQMACCFQEIVPNCVLHTLLISSTSLGLWGCAAALTGQTIYATNPLLPTTSESAPSETTASLAATSTPTLGNSTSNDTGERKSSTGTIVGGVVGGVGGIAIFGAAIFLFMRNRKKRFGDKSPSALAAAQPMLHQDQQSPSPGQGSPFSYNPQSSPFRYHSQRESPAYDPYTAYQHYHDKSRPYPQPPQSPYNPYFSGQSWGQSSPGLTSSLGALSSTSAGIPGSGTMKYHHIGQNSQALELPQSNAIPIGKSKNPAELG